jgi:hypothetical protein
VGTGRPGVGNSPRYPINRSSGLAPLPSVIGRPVGHRLALPSRLSGRREDHQVWEALVLSLDALLYTYCRAQSDHFGVSRAPPPPALGATGTYSGSAAMTHLSQLIASSRVLATPKYSRGNRRGSDRHSFYLSGHVAVAPSGSTPLAWLRCQRRIWSRCCNHWLMIPTSGHEP